MDNYFGTCSLCVHYDLHEKFLGKYYCKKRKTYFPVFEKQCSSYFELDSPVDKRIEMVEKARMGKL